MVMTTVYARTMQRLGELYAGIAIMSVDAGSVSERAGIRAGDVLIKVNGVRVRTCAEYNRARGDKPELAVTVMCMGRELTLSTTRCARLSN